MAEPKMSSPGAGGPPPSPGQPDQPAQQPGSKRRWLNTWLIRLFKAAVSIGLIYLLVRTIQKDALQAAITEANPWWILAAVAIAPFNLILQGLRWHLLVKTELDSISFGKVFSSFLGGLSLGLITPGRVGEVGRIFLLEVPSRMRLAGLHVLDKLYFVAGIALLGPMSLFFMPGFHEALPDGIRGGAEVIVFILPLLYFVFALRPQPLRGLLLALQMGLGIKGRSLELLRAYDGIHTRHCLIATGLTLTQFIFIFTQFYFFSRAFEQVSWITAAHTYAAVLFVKSALPISLGSLGVGEWAAVSFYVRYGLAETTGFSASLMLFATNVLLPGLLGLLVLYRTRPAALIHRLRNVWGEAA
ncbi:flippase-like domain-containing protein [bacterium]|nr:flippase-like domain-containing protein [bacterium]